MKRIGTIQVPENVMLTDGEKQAIALALDAGKRFGYGNVISHLATAWAKLLIRGGHTRKDAIDIVSCRGPYPFK